MTEKSVYEKLAKHLSQLGMGYPHREDLVDILKENFSPLEAEVSLAIPNTVIPLTPVPLEEIDPPSGLSKEELGDILEGLASRGMLYSRKTEKGETGYALHQVGFGFPQTFFGRERIHPMGARWPRCWPSTSIDMPPKRYTPPNQSPIDTFQSGRV